MHVQGIWPSGSDGTDINGSCTVTACCTSLSHGGNMRWRHRSVPVPLWCCCRHCRRFWQGASFTRAALPPPCACRHVCGVCRSSCSNGRALQRPPPAGSTAATAATFTACASPRATNTLCVPPAAAAWLACAVSRLLAKVSIGGADLSVMQVRKPPHSRTPHVLTHARAVAARGVCRRQKGCILLNRGCSVTAVAWSGRRISKPIIKPAGANAGAPRTTAALDWQR